MVKKIVKKVWVYTDLEGKIIKVGKKVWVYTDFEEKNGKVGKNLQGQYQMRACKKFQHTLRNFFPDPPPASIDNNDPILDIY